jgi:hypothetical protein
MNDKICRLLFMIWAAQIPGRTHCGARLPFAALQHLARAAVWSLQKLDPLSTMRPPSAAGGNTLKILHALFPTWDALLSPHKDQGFP